MKNRFNSFAVSPASHYILIEKKVNLKEIDFNCSIFNNSIYNNIKSNEEEKFYFNSYKPLMVKPTENLFIKGPKPSRNTPFT